MSSETEVVLFNAVPLVALTLVYLGVVAAVAPNLWRQRGRTHPLDVAIGLTFPAIALSAAISGGAVLHDRQPLAGHLWLSLVSLLVVLAPAVLFLARWNDRALVLTGDVRARDAVQIISVRDRELEAVTALSNELAHAQDAGAIARILLPKVQPLLGVEFAALAEVDERGDEARGVLALTTGEDASWWSDIRIDLHNEPSGIASACRRPRR